MEKLLTVKEVAELMGIAEQTIRNKISEKTFSIPYMKIGRSVRMRPSEIKKFLEEREIKRA